MTSTSQISKELRAIGQGKLLFREQLKEFLDKHKNTDRSQLSGVILGYTYSFEVDQFLLIPDELYQEACWSLMERWRWLCKEYNFKIRTFGFLLDVFCPQVIDAIRKHQGYNDVLDEQYAQGDNPIVNIDYLRKCLEGYTDRELAKKVLCVRLLREYLFMQRHLPNIGVVGIIGAVNGLMEKWDSIYPDSDLFAEQLYLIAPKVLTLWALQEVLNVTELARDTNNQDAQGDGSKHDPVLPDGSAAN